AAEIAAVHPERQRERPGMDVEDGVGLDRSNVAARHVAPRPVEGPFLVEANATQSVLTRLELAAMRTREATHRVACGGLAECGWRGARVQLGTEAIDRERKRSALGAHARAARRTHVGPNASGAPPRARGMDGPRR